MKLRIIIMLAIGLLAFIALTYYFDTTKISDESLSANQAFILSKAELASLTEKANKGDVEASFKVYEYYAYAIDNEKLGFSWLLKTAKMGNAEAQYTLASQYQYFLNDMNKAVYWYKMAAAQHHERAIKALERIKDKK